MSYINQTNVSFQDQLLQPLRGLAAEIRSIRNHVVLSGELQEKQGPLVEKVRRIDEEAVRVVERAKQINRRMRRQVESAEKKACVANLKSAQRGSKVKSVARQNAGKTKAVALASWHKDVRAARQALKNEGYTGSLNLKKGMPVHQKITEIQNARAARELAAPGLAGRSRPVSPAQSAPLVQGERLALHRDAVVHAPPPTCALQPSEGTTISPFRAETRGSVAETMVKLNLPDATCDTGLLVIIACVLCF